MTADNPQAMRMLLEAQMKAEFELAHHRLILEMMPMTVTPPAAGLYLCREQVYDHQPRWNLITFDGRQWLCGGYVRMEAWAGPLS